VLSFARGLEGERIEVQPTHLLKDLENIIKDTFPKDIRLQFATVVVEVAVGFVIWSSVPPTLRKQSKRHLH
jgi:hypothetical protein